MRGLLHAAVCFLLAVSGGACAGERYYGSGGDVAGAGVRMAPGLAMDAETSVATADDVQNGLSATTNPMAGAFYADGGDADARSRQQNYFDSGRWTGGGGKEQAAAPRMLVHDGEIAVEVPKVDVAMAAFLAKLAEFGGYLQQQTGTALTVRLPAARFDEAFGCVRTAGRVLHEMRKADDVTEEFLDLGIRIDNARKARDRLLEVLKGATKVEDVLAVEKELRRLTEELERMEGRQKYLSDQVAMATLRVAFSAVAEAPPPPPHRRQPSRFAWINLIGAECVMGDF